MAYCVVILSKDARNLVPCVEAIRRCEQQDPPEIVVVDDGLDITLPSGPVHGNPRVTIALGEKPFVFARNANIGIVLAGHKKYDVILLNDDALLTTPGGFKSLQKLSECSREYGLIAPVCDAVGNPRQHPQGKLVDTVRDEPRMLCFTCVYIPRATIERVGLLDERYTGYGLDDDDYSLRVRNCGLKLGIYDGCRIDHSSLTSQYRGHGVPADFTGNMRLFIDKWGVDNWSNDREHSEFAHLFPQGTV